MEPSGPQSQAEFDAIFAEMTKDVVIEVPDQRTYEHLSLDALLELKDEVQTTLLQRKEMAEQRTDEGRRLKTQLMEIYDEIRMRRRE